MDAKFLVPFETARQLKEKGYPQDKSDYGYFDNGDSHPIIMFPADNFDCAAPTYHEVLDWLQGKGLCITCGEPLVKQFASQYTATVLNNNINEWCMCGIYPTREEALNAAILKALEMI